MSEHISMTRDEFRADIDESFLNGSRAAIMTVRGVLDELEARLDAATPGDVDGDA